ncbi:MAG: hypothetical protein WCK25_02360 [Actinomycetes bacterium]
MLVIYLHDIRGFSITFSTVLFAIRTGPTNLARDALMLRLRHQLPEEVDGVTKLPLTEGYRGVPR